MNMMLEQEILAALKQAGLEPRSFVRISHLRSAETGRNAYRVDHDRGSVKARRLESEPEAQRLAELRDELPDAFAPVRFRHGCVLIEDWIDGEALPDTPANRYVAEAGALLGELHARSALGARRLHQVIATEPHRLTAERSLREVAASGALGAEAAARLGQAMRRLDPQRAVHGLVHLDFCGENMVIDRRGRLRVVDNERIGLDALGFDLARAWYRWPLPDSSWETFCSAYASHLPFSDPLDSLPFWRIVAVARAAAVRLRAYPEMAAVPIGCLRTLAAKESQ